MQSQKNAIMEIIAVLSIVVNMLLLIQHVFIANHDIVTK